MRIIANQPKFRGTLSYYNVGKDLKPIENAIKQSIDNDNVDMYIAKGCADGYNGTNIYLFRATRNPLSSMKTHGVQLLTILENTPKKIFYDKVMEHVKKASDIAVKRSGGLSTMEKLKKLFKIIFQKKYTVNL